MKIKKIKLNGLFVYPATITAAIKDENFTKEGVPMTQEEINNSFSENINDRYTKSEIDTMVGDIETLINAL